MTGDLFGSSGRSTQTGSPDLLVAHCDGGSRGNPGPAGYGAVIEDADGRILARLSEFLGVQTNNFAEYSALLAVLRWVLDHGHKRLRLISDSELMVKQMKGQYKVASPALRPLWEEARTLSRKLEKFEIGHTLRGGNKEADRLANDAMDKGMGKTSGAPSPGAAPRADAYARPPASRPAVASPKPARQVLEGYVKNGVVHILEGELPDGIFVKILRD